LAAGIAANEYRYSGDYVFRVKSSMLDEVNFLLDYIDSKKNLETIYLLYVQNDYGESVKDSFLEIIDSKKLKLIGFESFSITETEFRTYLLKVKNANPDVLFISGWTNSQGMLIRQIGEFGIYSQIVSSSAPITQEVLDVAGDFANGVIYSLEFSLKEDDVLNKSVYSVENHRNNSVLFFEKFKERYDLEANLFSAMGYDTVMLAYNALKECGNDSDCVKDYFYSLETYNGASGIFSFDEYGDVSKEMYLMTIRNGEFVSFD
jgi:branched-chain amino acid transport system substrate-binding protein